MDAKLDAKRLEELVAKCNAACESQDFGMAEFLDTADIADLARCAKAWAKVERLRGTLDFGDGMAVYLWRDTSGQRQYTAMPTGLLAVELAQDWRVCPGCTDGSETVGDGTFGGTEQQSCSTCGGTQRIAAIAAVEAAPEVGP